MATYLVLVDSPVQKGVTAMFPPLSKTVLLKEPFFLVSAWPSKYTILVPLCPGHWRSSPLIGGADNDFCDTDIP